jgi:hypothetical protein
MKLILIFIVFWAFCSDEGELLAFGEGDSSQLGIAKPCKELKVVLPLFHLSQS